MVKKYKGGSTATTVKLEVDYSFTAYAKSFLNGIKTVITTLTTILVTCTVLLACLAVVFMFIGSYIFLGYFLQAINIVFVGGINGIITFVLLIASMFVSKKQAKKMKKKAKLKKIPTDPSKIVLKALGLKSFTDDETTETTEEDDEECSAE